MKNKFFAAVAVTIFLITLGVLAWLLVGDVQNSKAQRIIPSEIPYLPFIKGFSSFIPSVITKPILPTATAARTVTSTNTVTLTFINPTRTFTPTPTLINPAITPTTSPGIVQETFEGKPSAWQVLVSNNGTGSVTQSQLHPASGASSALISTSTAGSSASINALSFSDMAGNHFWGERPGTYFWQRGMVYLPSATVQSLSSQGYLDLAGFWPSSGGTYGWWLRVRRDTGGNASLSVYGYDANGNPAEFNVYAQFPLDRWVDFSIGHHTQGGPGVKRAFAFLIDGNFYGWYHQGHMNSEKFDHAAMGILNTNVASNISVFVDQWFLPISQPFPSGPDNRPAKNLQTQDFRSLSGAQWQIDWSTWGNNLFLDPSHGIYSATDRLQSGRNLDRMPPLQNGWAQIEIDWPSGNPPANASLTGSFGGLVGFHKEINREQNLEVSPIIVNGTANLIYDAWTGNATVLASWPLPKASLLTDGRNLPEPGDIIRVRWEQIGNTSINLRVSYFDASTNTWFNNVINDTHDLSSVPSQDSSLPGNVNFLDGNHLASSITIDTPYYSIRQYTVGTLDTYPGP
jgi:hypothetical protein